MGNMKPFWKEKRLDEMSEEEWELLCDHCGRCCLHKVAEAERGVIHFTGIACKLYDFEKGGCREYDRRSLFVPECIVLSAKNIAGMAGLPKTCAYRLLHEGKPLPVWHPLHSGMKDSAKKADMSIQSFAVAENEIDLEYLEGFILDSDL
jgi:uncharacterized protein